MMAPICVSCVVWPNPPAKVGLKLGNPRRVDISRRRVLPSSKSSAPWSAGGGKIDVAAELIDKTRWKSPPLAKVVGYDPFALPASFPQPPKATAGGTTPGGSSRGRRQSSSKVCADASRWRCPRARRRGKSSASAGRACLAPTRRPAAISSCASSARSPSGSRTLRRRARSCSPKSPRV